MPSPIHHPLPHQILHQETLINAYGVTPAPMTVAPFLAPTPQTGPLAKFFQDINDINQSFFTLTSKIIVWLLSHFIPYFRFIYYGEFIVSRLKRGGENAVVCINIDATKTETFDPGGCSGKMIFHCQLPIFVKQR